MANFTNIHYFLAVVDEGGISAASRTLYISQQSLSEQLKKLETEVGVPTFYMPPCFPSFLAQFQARHPEYEIAIVKRWHNGIARSMSGVDMYLSCCPTPSA